MADSMPPLPKHVGEESHGPSQSPVKLYDADQMHAYAAACVAAERASLLAVLRMAGEALEGVIRVADRATVEFDAARAALSAIKALEQ